MKKHPKPITAAIRAAALAIPMALAASIAFIQAPPAHAQASPIDDLEAREAVPLLSLPELGAHVLYFIEKAEIKGESRSLYWVANRGREPVHFRVIWVMQDGRPQAGPEGIPAPIPPRLHLSPGGRLCLAPPEGFAALRPAGLRVGPDVGPFIDPATGRPAGQN
jgi:hypothetical protein